MQLKATLLGKHLAQHPYHQITLLEAGVELLGPQHHLVLPFNQIISFSCKRGLIWGELEFILPDEKAVRLHGIEWQATQQFYEVLLKAWQAWSRQIVEHALKLLQKQVLAINTLSDRDCWLPQSEFIAIGKKLDETYAALPIPAERIGEFKALSEIDYLLEQWRHEGLDRWHEHNYNWINNKATEHAPFFAQLPFTPDPSQSYVIFQQEPNMLLLGAPGSGKTLTLLARAVWLLYQRELALNASDLHPVTLPLFPDQILLLTCNQDSLTAMESQRKRFDEAELKSIPLLTPYRLAFMLLKQTTKKVLNMADLVENNVERQTWLLAQWQQLCSTKKPFAKLWRTWLSEKYEWDLPDHEFWLDAEISVRMLSRLDRWLKHLRWEKANKTATDALAVLKEQSKPQSTSHTTTAVDKQADLSNALASPEELQITQERKLFAPLLKAWKDYLKAEQAIDEPEALLQAIKSVGRAKFVTPWRHIMADQYQEFSLLARLLLKGLAEKSIGANFLYAADDAQILTVGQNLEAIDELIEQAKLHPEHTVVYELEHDYRLVKDVRLITDDFILKNPAQQQKPILETAELKSGKSFAARLFAPKHKNSVYLQADQNLSSILDKLSSYATIPTTILFTAQYDYQLPHQLKAIQARWPNFTFIYLPFERLHGVEVDFTFIFGLQQFGDSFPSFIRDTALEKFLLPEMESFLDAEMRRWLYVAMTRAKQSVWLMHDAERPSIFIAELATLGAKEK